MVNVLMVSRHGTDRALFSAHFATFRAWSPDMTDWTEVLAAINPALPLRIHASAYSDVELSEAFDRAAGRTRYLFSLGAPRSTTLARLELIIMTWIYPNGRTAQQATIDGDYYLVTFRRDDDPRGVWDGESNCPGAGGIDEALYCARLNFKSRHGRTVFLSRVLLPGSRIGCMIVEDHGTAIL